MAAVTPKLSVTVLNYNYGRFLPTCLDSILSQTYRDFELILIDDGSTDNSLEVIQPYLADPRVRLVVHEQNQGYLPSLFEGTEVLSRGDFLSVISADDYALRPDAFARQIETLEANAGMTYCFSAYDRILADGEMRAQPHRSFAEDRVIRGDDAFRAIVADRRVQVAHSGTILRRSAYERVGGYRRDLAHALDLAMWLQLAMEGDVGYIADALYGYRIHDLQMTGSLAARQEVTTEILGLFDELCAEAERRGIYVGELKRSGTLSHLFSTGLDEVFRGLETLALRRCLSAVRVQPLAALRSRYLWIIVARAVLGPRGFSLVRRVAILPFRRRQLVSRA